MKKIIMIFLLLPIYRFGYAQPANDNPCGAISIPVENLDCEPTTVYSYTGATVTPGSYGGCINGTSDKDVWYKVTVAANGRFTFKMAQAPGESQLIIATLYRDGNCAGQLIPLQSDNGIVCFFSLPYSGTAKNLTPGSTVHIRVYKPDNAGGTSGSFKMCVSNETVLTDEPCNAGFFVVDPPDPLGQNCVPYKEFSWAGATLTPAIVNPNPTCLFSDYYPFIRDVWFKVKVPASGRLKINMINCNYLVQVLSATACNGTYTDLGCINCLSPGVFNSLVPNSTIYCRVFPNSASAVQNGTVKICVAEGNQVPSVNNNSKVGIGIDTPFAKLDVVGNGIFRDKLTAGSDLEVRGNLILQGNIVGKFGNALLQGNTTIQGGPLTIDSLDIGSRLGNRLSLFGGLGNSPKYGFGIQGGTLQMFSDAAAANITFGYGNSYNFTERARIINQGEYGMTLKGRLQLNSGTQSAGLWLTNTANTVNTSFIGMQSDNLVGLYGATGAGWGLSMNTTTGNVGIGLNGGNPTVPLQFSNALGLTKISLYKGTYGDVGIGAYGGELRLQNDIPNGKVSFGVLETTGTFTELAKAERNGAFAFSIFGNLWANGTTYPSDGRFKKNIQPLQQSLEKILQLQGVSYEMKTDEFPNQHFDKGSQVGLIAQDVEKLVPQVVTEGPNGYKAIDYAKLVPLLIESIKELNKKIEILEARLKF